MDTQKSEKHLGRRSGFTMIEIILVVVIIGILASIGIPKLTGKSEQARITKAKATISLLSMAIAEYEIINGTYPSSLEGLLDTSKNGPFLDRSVVPTDPWEAPFSYSAPGSHNTHSFDISCTSPKGTLVNNWE